MRQHLLYLGSESQVQIAKEALVALKARKISASNDFQFARLELTHSMLEDMVLDITLITEIEAVTSQLRHNAIDLLIYDERGGVDATEAISKIRDDVKILADHWGPDFMFPMSRVVTVLNATDGNDRSRIFELGKSNVRDVHFDPKSTRHLLLWIKDILWHGIKRENHVGLALSGGGLEGFLYQLGALFALESCLQGKDGGLKNCDVISGVSSGALAGTLFGSQVPLLEVIRSFVGTSKDLPRFTSRTLFDIAATNMTKRVVKNTVSWTGFDIKAFLNKTMKSIPTGFFKGDSLEGYFKSVIEYSGREDKFPEGQRPEIYIGATDQDSFQHVTFGGKRFRDMKLSEAMRASCALPPLFAPKQINGRYYIDGQVTKTCNLELVIEKGCRLVVILNPLKPYASHTPGAVDKEGGVYGIIQTIKALVSTRLQTTLSHCTERYPDTDFIVFEPEEECAELMAGSPMRYNIRTKVIWLAFRDTLRKIASRYPVYQAKFQRYGLELVAPEELQNIEDRFLSEFTIFRGE